MSSAYGVNERIGLEGLELMGEQRRCASTPATEPSINLDVLVEVHIECSIELSAARGDVNIMPGWNPRGSARTTDDNVP